MTHHRKAPARMDRRGRGHKEVLLPMSTTEYDADGFNRPPGVYDANRRRGKLHRDMEGLLWRVRADGTTVYEYKTEKASPDERSAPLGSDEREAIRQWKLLSAKAETGELVIAKGNKRFADAWAVYHTNLTRWVERGKMAAKTKENYASVYDHHLREQWGGALLKGIEPRDIADYFTDKTDAGLSQAYQKQLQTVMAHCFQVALDEKWLTGNPLLLVNHLDLPKQQTRADYEPRLLRNEELVSMFLACNKLYTRQLITLAYTGMRMGELCGLRWENVNLTERVVYVRAQLEVTRGKGETTYTQGPPKGKRSATHLQSRRDIDLLDGAYEALATQHENETAKGYGGPEDWVFTGSTSTGLPVIPANFRHRGVQDAALAAGLGHVRPHDFRHTTASILAAAGVPDTVAAQMMGHTTAMYQAKYARAFRDAIERRDARTKLTGVGFGGKVAV